MGFGGFYLFFFFLLYLLFIFLVVIDINVQNMSNSILSLFSLGDAFKQKVTNKVKDNDDLPVELSVYGDSVEEGRVKKEINIKASDVLSGKGYYPIDITDLISEYFKLSDDKKVFISIVQAEKNTNFYASFSTLESKKPSKLIFYDK